MSLIHEALKKAEAESRQENYSPPPIEQGRPARRPAPKPAPAPKSRSDRPRPIPPAGAARTCPEAGNKTNRRQWVAGAVVALVVAAGGGWIATALLTGASTPRAGNAAGPERTHALPADPDAGKPVPPVAPPTARPNVQPFAPEPDPQPELIVEPINPEQVDLVEAQPDPQPEQPQVGPEQPNVQVTVRQPPEPVTEPDWLSQDALQGGARRFGQSLEQAGWAIGSGYDKASDQGRQWILAAAKLARKQRRWEQQRQAAERAAQLQQARLAAEKRLEAQRRRRQRQQQQELQRMKAEAERLAAQRAELERLAAQRAEAERKAFQQEQARLAAEKEEQARQLAALQAREAGDAEGPEPVASVEPQADAQANLPELNLQGILFSYDQISAVINNKSYQVNDVVNGAKIVHIERTMVKLEYDGRTIVLRL